MWDFVYYFAQNTSCTVSGASKAPPILA